MLWTASLIASLVDGTVEGDGNAAVSTVAKIEEAGPDALAFLGNPKYEAYLYTTGAGIVIVSRDLQLRAPVAGTLIRTADPYGAFTALLQEYSRLTGLGGKKGVEQPSFISPEASVDEEGGTYIGAFAYVGPKAAVGRGAKIFPGVYIGDGAVVGEGTILYAGVKIYAGCRVGAKCILHAGAVIGSDGFGYAPSADGSYTKTPQIGIVVVEDEVEIGANTTVDRATMGTTTIRRGAKIDNLVQVAHNVEIGEHTAIAAQSGISGSTRIGRGVIIGGQVGIVGHLRIADRTRINAQSGVSKSVESEGAALNGSPAFEYRSALKSQAVFRHLPELQSRIQQLEETVRALEARLSAPDSST